MTTTEVKELQVRFSENAKRIMYLAKEFLLNVDQLDIVSGTESSPIASRACENLARLKYITYANILTSTFVSNNRRRTRLVIRIKKTEDFKKLYDENEALRKKKEAQSQSK